MAPHYGLSWILSYAEYPQPLSESLPELFPSGFPMYGHFRIVQNLGLVFLHGRHELPLQGWVMGDQFPEYFNGDGQPGIIGIRGLKLRHHIESAINRPEHLAELCFNDATNALGRTLEVHERTKFKRIIKTEGLSEPNLKRLNE
jgi:hypothetical protein